MRPRELGRTGLSVTPIGLGLAALGRPGYLTVGHAADLPRDRSVAGLREHAHLMLDRAASMGIGYVDAARSYGRAEDFLAGWLESRPTWSREITVGSKWGYVYTAGWQAQAEEHEVKDHSLATLQRQLHETRERLGTQLDLYQVHSATLESGVLDDGAVLDALGALAAEGTVVGLTLSGPDQARTLERALELASSGRAPFRSVQASWNPLEPSAGPMLAAAHEAGWGVIVKEAVANGRLTPRGDPPPAMRAVAEEHRTSVDAVALAAALAQPFVDVVLSGAATPAQLESNLRAHSLVLAPGAVAELTTEAERPTAYWQRRSSLEWT